MKKILITILLCTAGYMTTSVAQNVIPIDSAKNHIGQKATVVGKVVEVSHSEKVIHINFGGKFPANTFSAVIFSKEMNLFSEVDSYEGKEIEITGTITEYQGKPQIILDKPDKIKLR
jgi:DNA/RNA endonuclease YhcR with UshA esterase domain